MAKEAKKIVVPGHLVDAVKLRMFEKKISYTEAAEQILKEKPEAAKKPE